MIIAQYIISLKLCEESTNFKLSVVKKTKTKQTQIKAKLYKSNRGISFAFEQLRDWSYRKWGELGKGARKVVVILY